jgi:hypothetical protein
MIAPSGLTRMQAKILKYACEHSEKVFWPNGLMTSDFLKATKEELFELTGEKDIQRLDRELDHLCALKLLDGGFHPMGMDLNAGLTPTALALQMYVRCQGERGSPVEYFRLESIPSERPA